MKVKIGDIYDAEKEPILLILSESDKNNLKDMGNDKFRYCSFPEDYDIDEVIKFMKIG